MWISAFSFFIKRRTFVILDALVLLTSSILCTLTAESQARTVYECEDGWKLFGKFCYNFKGLEGNETFLRNESVEKCRDMKISDSGFEPVLVNFF